MGVKKTFIFLLALAFALFLLLGPAWAFGQTTVPVTGHLGNAGGAPVSGVYLHAQLTNCGSNQPRVFGVFGIIKQTIDFLPDTNGLLSGNVFPNDAINCGGVTGGTRYNVSYIVNNVPAGPAQCFLIPSGGTFNFDTATPCSFTTPPPPPPGPNDATYRNLTLTGLLSGVNAIFSGTVQAHQFLLDFTPSPCSSGNFLTGLTANFSAICGSPSGAPVTSVFGRGAAVIAVSGDYTCAQVTGCAAAANLRYQTLGLNGTSQTQRNRLNFSASFTSTDNSGTNSSDVDIANVGTAGTYSNPSSITTDAKGRVTSVTAGATLNDFSWTATGCATGVGQPNHCTGTTTLPANMPDASYTIQCTANAGGSEPADYVCGLHTATPLPTTTGSTITFAIIQVMQNGTTGTFVPTVYFHAHHN